MKVRHRIASRRFPKPQDFLKAPTAIDQTSYVEDPLKPNEPYKSPIHLRALPLQYSSCRMSLDPNLREDRIRRLVSVLNWGLEIAGALLLLIPFTRRIGVYFAATSNRPIKGNRKLGQINSSRESLRVSFRVSVKVIMRNFWYDSEALPSSEMIEYAREEMDPMLC